MVKLRRIVESRDHVESLKTLLKFYSKDKNNWDKEWSVNPYYMVDLKKYGAGNCVCGHAIRYQFQFLNSLTGKTFPVGSVCVHLLNLSKFDETVDKLERINRMAREELNSSLSDIDFVKQYKKYFSEDDINALSSYEDIKVNPYLLMYYKTNFTKRKFDTSMAERMRKVIEQLHDQALSFISNIERKSEPVSPNEVRDIIDDSAEEMIRFATAKQNKLPF